MVGGGIGSPPRGLAPEVSRCVCGGVTLEFPAETERQGSGQLPWLTGLRGLSHATPGGVALPTAPPGTAVSMGPELSGLACAHSRYDRGSPRSRVCESWQIAETEGVLGNPQSCGLCRK